MYVILKLEKGSSSTYQNYLIKKLGYHYWSPFRGVGEQ
jgi:hypothetical protein